MINIILSKSLSKNKKFKVVISKDGKKIKTLNFGDSRYEDYTIHKNIDRKNNYISRHKENEDWNDILTNGFWSKNLLWNMPTLSASIKDIENKYKVKISKN